MVTFLCLTLRLVGGDAQDEFTEDDGDCECEDEGTGSFASRIDVFIDKL